MFIQVFWGLETVAGRPQKRFLKNNTWKSSWMIWSHLLLQDSGSLVDQLEAELRRPSAQAHRLMGTWVEGLPQHWGDSSRDRLQSRLIPTTWQPRLLANNSLSAGRGADLGGTRSRSFFLRQAVGESCLHITTWGSVLQTFLEPTHLRERENICGLGKVN